MQDRKRPWADGPWQWVDNDTDQPIQLDGAGECTAASLRTCRETLAHNIDTTLPEFIILADADALDAPSAKAVAAFPEIAESLICLIEAIDTSPLGWAFDSLKMDAVKALALAGLKNPL